MLNEDGKINYKIYKDEVFQSGVVVEVTVNEGEAETSVNCMFINKNRDLKIAFSDGSNLVLSELIEEL